MAQWITVKCRDCGAPLKVEEGASQVRCEYCGTVSALRPTGMLPAAAAAEPELAAAPIDAAVREQAVRAGRRAMFSLLGVALAIALGSAVAILASGGGLGGGVGGEPSDKSLGASFGEHMQWVSGGQPILHDTDGNGRPELFGWVRFLTGEGNGDTRVAGFDLERGERLWDVSIPGCSDAFYQCRLALVGDVLLAADPTGGLRAIEVAGGRVRWQRALGERAERLCRTTSGQGWVKLADGQSFAVDLATGERPAEAGGLGEDCDHTWRDRPPGTPGVEVSRNLAHEFRQALQPDGLTPEALLTPVEGDVRFLLASRTPGTRVPVVAALGREGAGPLLWRADVPSGNPLTAGEGAPPVAGFCAGRLFVPYATGPAASRSWQLVAFDARTGQRLWEVPVPHSERGSDPDSLVCDGQRVYLGMWTWLYLFAADTGAHLGTIGRW